MLFFTPGEEFLHSGRGTSERDARQPPPLQNTDTLHDAEGRKEAMETPVSRKVQGKTAQVLRKEIWPGPDEGKELEKGKRSEEC